MSMVGQIEDLQAENKRLAEGPWRCPIGIEPQHRSICSARSCYWCLSDHMKWITAENRTIIQEWNAKLKERTEELARLAEEWDSGWGEDRNTRVARQTAIEIADAIRRKK